MPASLARSQFHRVRWRTDPVSVMKQGVALGLRTWNAFLGKARLGERTRSTK